MAADQVSLPNVNIKKEFPIALSHTFSNKKKEIWQTVGRSNMQQNTRLQTQTLSFLFCVRHFFFHANVTWFSFF